MHLLLDTKTIFITLFIGHIFTAVLVGAVWLRNHKDQAINTFFFAKCVQTTAWCYLILSGGITDVLTICLFNTIIYLGDSLELIAVLKLKNMFNSVTKNIYISLTASFISGFLFIVAFYNEEYIRISFASLGTAALIIIPAYKLLKERTSSLLSKLMGYFYLHVIVFFILRTLGVLLTNHSMSLFSSSIFQTISLLALFLIMMMGNTGFILLLKEQAEQELLRLASYDDLTATLNRRTFIERAKQNLSVYAKKKRPISLLLFDVDRFKEINDTYGHDIGDRVLQALSNQINQQMRPGDLFGRYGGDEFAILLPGMDENESFEFAEKTRRMIAKSAIQGTSLAVTLSLGVITVIPDEQMQLESLYILCDQALYGAKNSGRNCVYRNHPVIETA